MNKEPLNSMTEIAIQQLIGFRRGTMGLSILSLVQEMDLTREEWETIRS